MECVRPGGSDYCTCGGLVVVASALMRQKNSPLFYMQIALETEKCLMMLQSCCCFLFWSSTFLVNDMPVMPVHEK